jgi:hypothetical protein
MVGSEDAVNVHIQAHKTRNAAAMVRTITAQGHVVTVHTDRSDHYLAKGHARLRGNWENYYRILQAAARHGDRWQIILQDDVSLPDGLFDRMQHVLSFMPGGVVTFYVPQAQLFQQALAEQRYVVETWHGQALLATAIHQNTLADLVPFAERHIQPAWDERGDGCADDDCLILYAAVRQQPCRVIVPSFVQHVGLYTSTFKTSWKVGKYPRISACYEPEFDVRAVDWAAAVQHPLVDTRRLGRSDPRWSRAVGL